MHLLIVEDDHALGEALSTGLRQLGHVVDWFRDGAQADAALASAPFDAVVLDLGLPGGDGMSWLGRWRARQLSLPVLILTARDGIEQHIAGLDAGADDYLLKPISNPVLRPPALPCSSPALLACEVKPKVCAPRRRSARAAPRAGSLRRQTFAGLENPSNAAVAVAVRPRSPEPFMTAGVWALSVASPADTACVSSRQPDGGVMRSA